MVPLCFQNLISVLQTTTVELLVLSKDLGRWRGTSVIHVSHLAWLLLWILSESSCPRRKLSHSLWRQAHCLKTLKGLGAQARNPFLYLRRRRDKCSLHYLTRFGGVGPTLAKFIYWWSLNTTSALCCSPLLCKIVPSTLDQKLPVFLFIWTQQICSFLKTHAIWEGIGKKRLGRSRVRRGVKVEGVQWGQNFSSYRIQSSFWTLPSAVWKGQLSWLNPSPSLLTRYRLWSFFCDKPMVMASGT